MQPKETLSQLNGFIFENNGFTAQLCSNKASLRTAFDLRYRAYKHSGDEVNMDDKYQLFFDGSDFAPNSRTFLIWYEGKAVASVRSCIRSAKYDWAPIESMKYCEQDIRENLGSQSILLESGRYVVDPEFKGRKSIYAQILLFKVHAIVSLIDECSHIITMVRPRHIPFYERMLGFHQVSPIIPVPEFDLEIALLACPREKSLEVALNKGMPPYTKDEVARYKKLLEQEGLSHTF